MTDSVPGAPVDTVDVGAPLSPAEAGMLEYELERRGIATRLRFCDRCADGHRQAVQVAPGDLETAMAVRAEILAPATDTEPPPRRRSHRIRNAAIAGALGLVASLRVVRLVRIPAGPRALVVVLAVTAALFAAAFGLTKDGGP